MAYEITLVTTMAISILFALSLNFITGFCGQISLGHAAFMGVGAYTSAVMMKAEFPFLLTIPLAAAFAGLLGVLVGFASLRVRHDFLAITTMGVVFLFVGLVRQQELLGGEIGIDSSADNEDISRVLGIDVSKYKLIAFVVGTSTAGIAGALYTQHFRFVGPDSFGFVESITVLAMVIVGGIGSVWGVAVAAAFLSVMPLLFQFVNDFKILVYGALLFCMMRWAPDGLAGIVSRLINRLRNTS
jgi:branched-chain amino acid transport system permease protein